MIHGSEVLTQPHALTVDEASLTIPAIVVIPLAVEGPAHAPLIRVRPIH